MVYSMLKKEHMSELFDFNDFNTLKLSSMIFNGEERSVLVSLSCGKLLMGL
jgi:hypothetical protein